MEAALNLAGKKANEILSAKDIEKEKAIEEVLIDGYKWIVNGVPNVAAPMEEIADEYTGRYATKEDAAKAMIRNYLLKSGCTGFLTGLGGVITMPVTIPMDMMSVMIMQMRMVAGIASIGGYDLHADEVRTIVFACLTGQSVSSVLKDAGINIGEKLAVAGIRKIPAEAIRAINKKVGFRILTKFGETGAINLGKTVPIVGGVVGGGFDAGTTKIIADIAYKTFIAA